MLKDKREEPRSLSLCQCLDCTKCRMQRPFIHPPLFNSFQSFSSAIQATLKLLPNHFELLLTVDSSQPLSPQRPYRNGATCLRRAPSASEMILDDLRRLPVIHTNVPVSSPSTRSRRRRPPSILSKGKQIHIHLFRGSNYEYNCPQCDFISVPITAVKMAVKQLSGGPRRTGRANRCHSSRGLDNLSASSS